MNVRLGILYTRETDNGDGDIEQRGSRTVQRSVMLIYGAIGHSTVAGAPRRKTGRSHSDSGPNRADSSENRYELR